MQLHALLFIYAFCSWRTFKLHPVTGSWFLCSGHHCKHFLNWCEHFPLCVSERKSSRQTCAWASSCCPIFPDESCLHSGLLCCLTSTPYSHLVYLPFRFVLDWQTVSTCCCLEAIPIVKACTLLIYICFFLLAFRAVVLSLWIRTPPQQKSTGKHGYLHYDS